MFTQIVDRILQLNLYTVMTGFLAEKVGVVSVVALSGAITHDSILKTAVLTSAVTGAIYGIYRIVKLSYDGIVSLTNYIKNKKEDKIKVEI